MKVAQKISLICSILTLFSSQLSYADGIIDNAKTVEQVGDQMCTTSWSVESCKRYYLDYVAHNAVPTQGRDALLFYISGFVVNVCLSGADARMSSQISVGSSPLCFEKVISASKFKEISSLQGACPGGGDYDIKKRNCYSEAFRRLHVVSGENAKETASCEARLLSAENQLLDLNSKVTNADKLKSGIDEIVQKIKAEDKAAQAQ